MLVGEGLSTNIFYHALAESFSIDAVIFEPGASRRKLLARRMKKLGLWPVAGQVLFMTGVLPLVRYSCRHRARRIIAEHRLNTAEIPQERVIHTPSLNSDATIAILRRFAPQVVVVNGTGIIQERVLNSISAPFINTHVGITPLYRGVHGGYWAMACGDRQNCGVTIHQVNKGIDTGPILAQAVVSPTAEDSFSTYPLLQFAVATRLLKQAVTDALAGTLRYQPPPSGQSRLWSHPTAWQYLRNWMVLGVR
jgi:methionyl-tRNA formyltransferase